jgi:FG-GAP repeat
LDLDPDVGRLSMRRALLVVGLCVASSFIATIPAGATSRPAPSGLRSDFNGDGVADLAIGAPGADEAGVEGAGAVNVLFGTAASGLQAEDPDDQRWTQAGDIDGDLEAGERFGAALASGDFSGDGFADLAIGVPNADFPGNVDAGEVNVIYGSATGLTPTDDQLWYQRGPVVKGNPGPNEHFGGVLTAGDFNGDGFDDLAIGIPGDVLSDQSGVGGVIVLFGAPGGLQAVVPEHQLWSQANTGVDGTAEAGDHFGAALAAGDMNGDGFDDLAIGVPGEDLMGSDVDTGATNILYGSPDGPQTVFPKDQLWTQDRAGVSGTAEAGDAFGSGLAASNPNGDEFADLAVGASLEDLGSRRDAGVVHLLYGEDGGLQASSPDDQLWSQDSPGVQDAAEPGDRFGRFLVFADFGGDGFADLAVGVPFEDSPNNSGVVHVLPGSADGLTSAGNQVWSQNSSGVDGVREAGDRFGSALGGADFNMDSFDDLAIGVPRETVGDATGTGAVNTLYGSASGLQVTSPADQLWHEGVAGVQGEPAPGNSFGSALSGVI